MQSKLADNDQIPPVSGRLVGARGANAAQRAREFRLAAVPVVVDEAPEEIVEVGQGAAAELEEARRSDAPAADSATPANSNSSKGAPRGGAASARCLAPLRRSCSPPAPGTATAT